MDACYSLHYRKIRILIKMYLFNLQVIPRWCADKRPCWEKIVERWTDAGWQDEHKAISERRKLMGCPGHRQGNLTIPGVVSKHVGNHILFFSSCSLSFVSIPLIVWIAFFCRKKTLARISLTSRHGPSNVPETTRTRTLSTRRGTGSALKAGQMERTTPKIEGDVGARR